MDKKVVVTLTGIRPDFIRMSEIFRRLDEHPDIQHILIHSGQHFDANLSDVFFAGLKIRKPDYNLGIGGVKRDHVIQQSLLGPAIISLLRDEKIVPDIVLFLGDSNSSLAAIPLKKEGVPVGHIEAGMRSGDEWMPEEVNRICCDHVSNILFPYHTDNLNNLISEGIDPDRCHVVGNTLVEVARPLALEFSKLPKTGDFILVDIHRHENVENYLRLYNIINFVSAMQRSHGLDVCWIGFKRSLKAIGHHGLKLPEGFRVVDPMGYREFCNLQYHAAFMISDSGTAQEEPALFGTPVLVPRSSTERPQSLEADCSRMVDVGLRYYEEGELMSSNLFIQGHRPGGNLSYETAWLGDGFTSQYIVEILARHLPVK